MRTSFFFVEKSIFVEKTGRRIDFVEKKLIPIYFFLVKLCKDID